MSDFKNKDIMIYGTDHVHIAVNQNRIEGDLNKVIWSDLDKIALSIANIIMNAGGKAETVSYMLLGGKDNIRIGKRITAAFDAEGIDIEILLNTFLAEITKSDNYSGELFNQNSSPLNEVIKTEARNFLLQNGNKYIKQALEISTDNSLIKIAGKFGQLANHEQNLDDPAEVHTGVVDGLIKHNRTVHLKLSSQKIIVAYFDQNDFLQLYHLLKSEVPHQFTVQKKYDAGGKKDMYLVLVAENSEKLLNFST